MGTETIGSIVTPSTRGGLYALKLTHGALDSTGVYTMSDFFDCTGPMAKSAADVRLITEILLKRTFDSANFGTWAGLSVGFLDPRDWTIAKEMCPPYEGTAEQMVGWNHLQRPNMANFFSQVEDYEAVVELLQKNGCPLKYPAQIASVDELTVDGERPTMPIACEYCQVI